MNGLDLWNLFLVLGQLSNTCIGLLEFKYFMFAPLCPECLRH
jgi:hypothetical protein